MKRIICILGALLVAFYLGGGAAYAQHGHGGGGGMSGMSGMHEPSTTHGHSAAAGEGHSASTRMASTNPGQVLDHNSHLALKLEGLLGISGPNALQTLKADASGFKNFGQFVAAVHVSHNLDIPFSALQAKMTGPGAVSLGKAIQELKPDANAKTEVKKAKSEADSDIEETS